MAVYRHQAGTITAQHVNQFYNDVINGLQSSPKKLSSKYFYDGEGDALFQQIMASPEYYLTDCEMEIFSQQTSTLTQTFLEKYNEFDVIELGAGDATKSVFLLKELASQNINFTYFPVDISANIIRYLEKQLPQQIKNLKVNGLQGEYFEMLKKANTISDKRKLILFLGSNIGNFSKGDAVLFLKLLQECMLPEDLIMIGFDLKKDPAQILAAYNDRAGVTKAFNLNLLNRINKEFGGDFDTTKFNHYPTYNPATGACESYLISTCRQTVTIADTEVFHFEKHEPIWMELSQKYSVAETDALAKQSGFVPVRHFFDSQEWFVDAIWQKV